MQHPRTDTLLRPTRLLSSPPPPSSSSTRLCTLTDSSPCACRPASPPPNPTPSSPEPTSSVRRRLTPQPSTRPETQRRLRLRLELSLGQPPRTTNSPTPPPCAPSLSRTTTRTPPRAPRCRLLHRLNPDDLRLHFSSPRRQPREPNADLRLPSPHDRRLLAAETRAPYSTPTPSPHASASPPRGRRDHEIQSPTNTPPVSSA